jgi:hypothetical protein
MSLAVDIAKDVAHILTEHDFSVSFSATFEPMPRMDIQAVTSLEVFVCPDVVTRDRSSRNVWQLETAIQIGVLKHVRALNRVNEITALTGLVEEIADFIGDARLPNVPTAQAVRFRETPLYLFDHLNEFSVFTSVLSVVYLTGKVRV